MPFEYIRSERLGDVLSITFVKPDRMVSASLEMLEEMISALRQLGTARAVLIKGDETGFCSELNTPISQGSQAEARSQAICIETLAAINDLPVPVVSAVAGRAAGIGCCIAVSADFCFASETAYFRLAHTDLSTQSDYGALDLLSQYIGQEYANALMSLGVRVDAGKAQRAGMIYKVVDTASLESDALALATRLAAGPTAAYAAIRHQIRLSHKQDFSTALRAEAEAQRALFRTADAREAIAADVEGRVPKFQGS